MSYTTHTGKTRTIESKAATKNGIFRLIFIGLSIIAQFVWLSVVMVRLAEKSTWVSVTMQLLAVLVVLAIFSQFRTSALKMPWIILILVFPILGVTLYLLLGLGRATKRINRRYQNAGAKLYPLIPQNQETFSALCAQEPDVANMSRYLYDYSRFPVYNDSEVEYFSEAYLGLESQLEALRGAKKFIFMEYHAIEEGESFGAIHQVLKEKAAEGVEVRLFYDDLGSIGFINTDFVKRMEKDGIRCRVFNPLIPIVNIVMNYRDHRKITVVDGCIGFTGGYNLADEYFNITHPFGYWKDTGLKITGPAVQSLTVMFLEMWNAVKSGDVDDKTFEQYLVPAEPCPAAHGFIQPYADSPLDNEQVGENAYMNIIESAKEYVYFMTPYLVITDEMNHSLSLAAKRGVDVRIITPGIPDKKIVYGTTRSYYANLVKDGVRIFEYTPGFLHAKQCISDNKVATCGTINLDYRSLYHHFENGCLLYNCKAVWAIKGDFDKTMKECREKTEHYSKGERSIHTRVWHLVLRLIAPLL